MVIMIWMQTGFAMVVLSAAIKAIPDEIIEAARIDGASELQIFRHVTMPSILPTVVVVTTYMVISSMKVFDIVFAMGNAESNGYEVVAERMIQWFFVRSHDGRGRGDRGGPVPRRDPGDGLERPQVPRAGGHAVTVPLPVDVADAPAPPPRPPTATRAAGSCASRSPWSCSSG